MNPLATSFRSPPVMKTQRPLLVPPNYIPVVVRPTVPLGYAPFVPDHSPSLPEVSFYPFPSPPPPEVSSTSKTRRELQQLGSPTKDFAAVFFELAAQRNGIKIGGNKREQAGQVKLKDSLEDFKKLAMRNGITVCPPGSKTKKKAESVGVTQERAAAATVRNVTSVDATCKQPHFTRITAENAVKNASEGSTNENHGKCLGSDHQYIGDTQDVVKSSGERLETGIINSDIESKLRYFKVNAKENGIEVEVGTDVEVVGKKCDNVGSCQTECRKENEGNELGRIDRNCNILEETRSSRHGIGSADRKSENEQTLDIDPATKKNIQESEEVSLSLDRDGSITEAILTSKCDFQNSELVMEGGAMSGTKELETEPAERKETAIHDAQVAKFQEMSQLNGIHVNEKGAGKILGAWEVAVLEDDPMIAKFQQIAQRKGIKVGGKGKETTLSSQEKAQNKIENVVALEEDPQIARFQEIAQLKGIRVCEKAGKNLPVSQKNKETREQTENAVLSEEDPQVARFHEIARRNGIKVGEKADTNILVSQENMNDALLLQRDSQLARFQEIAQLKGIKVGGKEAKDTFSSQENVDGAFFFELDTHIARCEEMARLQEIRMVEEIERNVIDYTGGEVGVMHSPDVFEQLARRNGIRIGQAVVSSKTQQQLTGISSESNHVLPRADDAALPRADDPAHGNPVTDHLLGKAVVALCQTSTQTVDMSLDNSTQTAEERGVLTWNSAVQVDAVKEAFEEELQLWKLDESAAGDDVELTYKELYFTEKRAREELDESLQNEKDVTANTRHNHKRVMEVLKEGSSNKTDEIEKLKKDLKTLKRQKETEIKRLTKELKSKDEDLESVNTTLQLKEVALDNLTMILREQTSQLKTLGERLQEMKTALSEAKNNAGCKTCSTRSTLHKDGKVTEKTDREKDAWTVFTGKKSRIPSNPPAKRGNSWDTPLSTSGTRNIAGLSDFDDFSPLPPHLSRQSDVEPCVSTRTNIDSFSPTESLENKVAEGFVRASVIESRPSVITHAGCVTPTEQQNTTVSPSGLTQPVELSRIQPQNTSVVYEPAATNCHDVKIPRTMTFDTTSHQSFPSNVIPAQSFPASGHRSKPPPDLTRNASVVTEPDVTNSNNVDFPRTTALGVTSHQPFTSTAVQAQSLPATSIPSQALSRYLSSLLTQPSFTPGRVGTNAPGSLRPPPGLNTEPVPEGDQSPLPPSGAKFSSFDKLMEALQKKFPDKGRQDLIGYLKKAKASCGGFKGKQICDVVECVEKVLKLETKCAFRED